MNKKDIQFVEVNCRSKIEKSSYLKGISKQNPTQNRQNPKKGTREETPFLVILILKPGGLQLYKKLAIS